MTCAAVRLAMCDSVLCHLHQLSSSRPRSKLLHFIQIPQTHDSSSIYPPSPEHHWVSKVGLVAHLLGVDAHQALHGVEQETVSNSQSVLNSGATLWCIRRTLWCTRAPGPGIDEFGLLIVGLLVYASVYPTQHVQLCRQSRVPAKHVCPFSERISPPRCGKAWTELIPFNRKRSPSCPRCGPAGRQS